MIVGADGAGERQDGERCENEWPNGRCGQAATGAKGRRGDTATVRGPGRNCVADPSIKSFKFGALEVLLRSMIAYLLCRLSPLSGMLQILEPKTKAIQVEVDYGCRIKGQNLTNNQAANDGYS